MEARSPQECRGMADIRGEIDRRDRQIIALLGERAGYVQAAAKFKASEEGVKAPERFKALLQVRREWAEQEGLDADMIEELYRNLVEHFIQREMKAFQKR